MIPFPMAAASFINPPINFNEPRTTYIPPDALLAPSGPAAPFAGLTADVSGAPVPMSGQPYYQGGAVDDIGIMQEPAIREALRRNIIDSLSGLESERARAKKEASREGYDRFAADILYPLTGFIPGKDNAKNALQASKDLLTSIDDRRKSRTDTERTKQDIILNLGKFIRGADPSDWENALKMQKETRMLDEAESRIQRRKDMSSENDKKIKLREQKQEDDRMYRQGVLEHYKTADGNTKARIEEQVKNNRVMHEDRLRSLEERKRHAMQIEDLQERRLEYQEIENQMDDLEHAKRDDEKLLMQIENLKFKTESKKADGKEIQYTPPTAESLQKKAAPAATKSIKQNFQQMITNDPAKALELIRKAKAAAAAKQAKGKLMPKMDPSAP
jgi:hypothetical protein